MQPGPQRSRLYSILQVLLSLGGFVFCALCALAALIFGLYTSVYPGSLNYSRGQLIGMAWIFAILALPAIPAFWYALQKILRRADAPPGRPRRFATASLALLAWLLVLAAGAWLSGSGRLGSYLLPPLSAVAVCIPLWWLVEFTSRGLGPFSPRRKWGALNFALFFSNPATMIVELLLVFAAVIAAGMFISRNAGAYELFLQFYQKISQSMGDTQSLQTLLLPLLANPWVALAVLACFSVVVPLLEELFKPLVVWTLLGLDAVPADGLVLGAIAGAGFGLTETLFGLSNVAGQSQWLTLVVARTGTNLLHITTTALIGWALISAWHSRKFARLGLAYLSAVLLHGLWNAFAVVSAMADIWLPAQPLGSLLSYAAMAGLLGVSAVCLAILFGANRRLRAAAVVSGLSSLEKTPTS